MALQFHSLALWECALGTQESEKGDAARQGPEAAPHGEERPQLVLGSRRQLRLERVRPPHGRIEAPVPPALLSAELAESLSGRLIQATCGCGFSTWPRFAARDHQTLEVGFHRIGSFNLRASDE